MEWGSNKQQIEGGQGNIHRKKKCTNKILAVQSPRKLQFQIGKFLWSERRTIAMSVAGSFIFLPWFSRRFFPRSVGKCGASHSGWFVKTPSATESNMWHTVTTHVLTSGINKWQHIFIDTHIHIYIYIHDYTCIYIYICTRIYQNNVKAKRTSSDSQHGASKMF